MTHYDRQHIINNKNKETFTSWVSEFEMYVYRVSFENIVITNRINVRIKQEVTGQHFI